MTTSTLYLIRHATPDWSRTDLTYHLPPGPPLVQQGEREAEQLGTYLKEAGVTAIYSSPLERCLRTAQIAGAAINLPVQIEPGLTELVPGESSDGVQARLRPVFESAREASQAGPVALITHGGPIALLLAQLGLLPEAINHYKRLFDRNNPLPPAGAWQAAQRNGGWELTLSFVPEAYRAKLYV
jgi:probable phosphoglycerate mutase